MARSPIRAKTLTRPDPDMRAVLVGLCLVAACKIGRETTASGLERRWDELDRAERIAFMSDVVEPQMKAEFQAFDPERFAHFDCRTCHGSGVDDGSYALPNPDLPHLFEDHWFRKHRREHPKTVTFMWKKVELGLSRSMGRSVGPKGELDCRTCHVIEDHDPVRGRGE